MKSVSVGYAPWRHGNQGKQAQGLRSEQSAGKGGFLGSLCLLSSCISIKPLRLEICEEKAARIWIISIEYVRDICQLQLFKSVPIAAGCLLIGLPRGHNNGDHDNEGSLEWSLSSSSYHQATVSQTA